VAGNEAGDKTTRYIPAHYLIFFAPAFNKPDLTPLSHSHYRLLQAQPTISNEAFIYLFFIRSFRFPLRTGRDFRNGD